MPSADDYSTEYYRSLAIVSHDGGVFWSPPTKFRSTCPVSYHASVTNTTTTTTATSTTTTTTTTSTTTTTTTTRWTSPTSLSTTRRAT